MREPFYITFVHDRKRYRYLVKQLPSDFSFDYFDLIAGNRVMKLKNNLPVMRRNNLKHRRPKWTVITGDVWNADFRTRIIECIEKELGF